MAIEPLLGTRAQKGFIGTSTLSRFHLVASPHFVDSNRSYVLDLRALHTSAHVARHAEAFIVLAMVAVVFHKVGCFMQEPRTSYAGTIV